MVRIQLHSSNSTLRTHDRLEGRMERIGFFLLLSHDLKSSLMRKVVDILQSDLSWMLMGFLADPANEKHSI